MAVQLIHSIVIGLVATVIAIAILALMSYVAAGQDQLLDILSENGSTGSVTFDLYALENSPFFLAMIALLLLEFLCGVLAILFVRPSGDWTDNLVASLAAGVLPALAFGIFYYNSWRTTMSQYKAHTYVRPMEPVPDFIAIGLIVFLMVICLLTSVAGSWLAQAALRSKQGV